MDWTAPIDIYCERLGPGFWAEPVNALSNLAFIAVSAYALFELNRSGRRDPALLGLALLVGAIGVGSFLFHTFANTWSEIADVAPITLFIYAYLALILIRFFALSWPVSVGLLVVFFVFNWQVEGLLSPLIAGSAAYVPALAALLALGAVLAARGNPAGRFLLMAGCVFLVSLSLRTLDRPLCPDWTLGTHWLWHLLNATTLALLLFGAMAASKPAHPAARASA